MLQDYNLEIDRIVEEINTANAKKVCIQLPDGLKPFAAKIVSELKTKTNTEIFLWASSNYGACDIPFYLDKFEFDLLVNLGHAMFKR
jgi:2-(3-amino-3-carboxypropyl)histidine synthase